MAQYATIRYDDSAAPVARITLHRPEKRNPIGPLTNGELIHGLERAGGDSTIRAIVITGAGEVFSAGGDVAALSGDSASHASPAQPASLVELLTAMHALGKPILAMVNGHARAGGVGLVAACDLAVASERATFALTEIKLGLWPMMITAELTRNLGRKMTLELMLTGRRISAAEAQALGLVNRVAAHDRLEAETMALAGEIAQGSPEALALGLRAFYEAQDKDFVAALRYLEGQFGRVLASEDAREGMAAFLERRPPKWRGR